MKILETIIEALILNATKKCLDPLQFAYQTKRNVDDAKLFILHTLYKHLEKLYDHKTAIVADFSSGFNTIQPYLLARRLIDEFFP